MHNTYTHNQLLISSDLFVSSMEKPWPEGKNDTQLVVDDDVWSPRPLLVTLPLLAHTCDTDMPLPAHTCDTDTPLPEHTKASKHI